MERKKKISKKISGDELELPVLAAETVSSPVRVAEASAEPPVPALLELDAPSEPKKIEKEYSPEFLALAYPELPSLAKNGNRGRLLMQSPTKLYFYWAVGKNPFHTLNRALGQAANYTLVLKLVDLRTDDEQVHAVDASGNWWFDVDSDGHYRAEIGFYAVNRPYIRVLYSNTVSTPRKSPSPRTADTAEWRVPAEKFAKVLDAAGFQRDAFDVALAGDDAGAADIATRSAFAQFSGRRYNEFSGLDSSEIRYAMLALASGVTLAELRGLISERLFQFLSSIQSIGSEQALAALRERFEFDAEEFDIDEEADEAIYGNSLVNFPRKLKKTRKLPDLSPLSSFGRRSS